MSKLDELLEEWDAGVKQYGSRNLATVAADMAAELRRLQSRERRLEELEAELVDGAQYVMPARGETYREVAIRIRAIREET